MKKKLTAAEYWEFAGMKKTREMCEKAGTTYEHFKHIAHNRRRPSVKLAKRLIEASGGKMGFMELVNVELIVQVKRGAAVVSADGVHA